MTDYDRLLEKLRRIEALFAGATTPGERDAASLARDRIKSKIGTSEPAEEYRFSLNNEWSRKLFIALLRRYDLKPYRYYRQRRNTVMVRVARSFVDKTLWPEFIQLDQALQDHLTAEADRIIRETISEDASEVDEIRGALPDGQTRDLGDT